VQLQASGYYPGLNLVELIDLFAGIYNRKVDPYDILRMVNLTISEEERRKLKDPAVSPEEKKKIQDKDKAKVQYKKLSGGQKQRFSIATTLINEPTIVFLDEPTTGLDPQARRSLWELVKTIRERGATVIITTHYMDEAEYLCDRVAIIDAGQIIALASPDKLIDELVDSGFERPKEVKKANLEDVFINLTGHALRED
jgi:ABC-2 type transport system ATP-binding protein